MATDDPVVHEQVLRGTLRFVAEMPFDRPPPWLGQRIHKLLRDATGNPDPYREVKRRSNALALEMYPTLKQRLGGSADPFIAAVRMAVAGNVIDFGCRSDLGDDEVLQEIDDAMDGLVDEVAVADLHRAVHEAGDIVYLADNAGEIVLDRLLIEAMPADRVTLVVRGGPIINDATREDAEVAGLSCLVAVMDNGSDVPGTILETCSPSFRSRFEECDLVIAKGQGNYETLSGQDRDIFFLFKAKCPVVARDIGGEVGRMVVCSNRREREVGSREPASRSKKAGV